MKTYTIEQMRAAHHKGYIDGLANGERIFLGMERVPTNFTEWIATLEDAKEINRLPESFASNDNRVYGSTTTDLNEN